MFQLTRGALQRPLAASGLAEIARLLAARGPPVPIVSTYALSLSCRLRHKCLERDKSV